MHFKGCLSDFPVGAGTQRNEACNRSFRANYHGMSNISVDLHSAMSGSFFTMYNRRRANDPTPLSSDFRVMETEGAHSKALVGMGVSGIVLKTKTPTTLSNIEKEKVDQIANNVKNMLSIEESICTNRSAKVSLKEILMFSHLTNLEKKESDLLTKDALWIIGTEINYKFNLLSSAILEQFISVSDFSLIENVFGMSFDKLTSKEVRKVFMSKVRKTGSKQQIICAAEFLKSCIIVVTPGKKQPFNTWLPSNIENKVPIVIAYMDNNFYSTSFQDNAKVTLKRKAEKQEELKTYEPQSKRQKTSYHSNKTKCRSNEEWFQDNNIDITCQKWENVEVYVMWQCNLLGIKSYSKKYGVFQILLKTHPELRLISRTEKQLRRLSNSLDKKFQCSN